MEPTNELSRRTFSLLALGTLLAACSSSGEAATTSTPATTPADTSPPVDTAAPTSVADTTPPVTDAPSTAPAVALPTMPLTGLPIPAGAEALAARPALVVKIDNHPDARPQSGLNAADIVFEENVEQLTRFAAVFHGGNANPVGPIRSGRTQDIALLGSFNRPLFAWSGGNRRVTDAISASDLRQISAQGNDSKGFYRRKGRSSPHNLYNNTDELFGLAPADAGPPPAQFNYRGTGDVIAGDDVAGVKISMDGVRVLWTWDANLAAFLRESDDAAHRDDNDGTQLSTQNIIVCFVEYAPSPADARSPEAQTLGSGEAWVLSGGKLVRGTWNRADRLNPFAFTDAAGAPVLLGPGRTWIELARTGSAADIPASADPASVKYP